MVPLVNVAICSGSAAIRNGSAGLIQAKTASLACSIICEFIGNLVLVTLVSIIDVITFR